MTTCDIFNCAQPYIWLLIRHTVLRISHCVLSTVNIHFFITMQLCTHSDLGKWNILTKPFEFRICIKEWYLGTRKLKSRVFYRWLRWHLTCSLRDAWLVWLRTWYANADVEITDWSCWFPHYLIQVTTKYEDGPILCEDV